MLGVQGRGIRDKDGLFFKARPKPDSLPPTHTPLGLSQFMEHSAIDDVIFRLISQIYIMAIMNDVRKFGVFFFPKGEEQRRK